MRLRIQTFGFAHREPPTDAAWVADVRDIPASAVDGYEHLDGRDPDLQAAIIATSAAQAWQRKVQFDALPVLVDDDLIAVGCEQGKHRSVAVAESIAETLRGDGHTIEVEHLDLATSDNSGSATASARDTVSIMGSMKTPPSPHAREWYNIRNAAESDTVDVFIYDVIGEDFWGEGIAAKNFVKDFAAITAANVNLRVNSPGGNVFDGVAIFNAILRHPANVTTYVDGIAASIASVIALAGRKVVMAENALFMIHNPSAVAWGTSAEMRSMADVLDKIRSSSLITTYANRTGKSVDELTAMLDAETWLSAEETVAAGFADEVAPAIAATSSFDLSKFGFRNAPAQAPAAGPQSSGTGGAPDMEPSGGASEPVKADVYFPGVGYVRI
jgi:ATP-dependent Clp protease, protease subunit